MESISPGDPEGLDEGCGLSGCPLGPWTLELIRDRIKWCETEGVEFLYCPEAVLGGLADDAQCPVEFAINMESSQLEALLAPLASRSVTAIVGFTETVGAGRLYNAAAVFHDGKIVGIYRKRYPAIRKSVYSVGDQSPVFKVGRLSFGIMICNDSNYPELAAGMAARGARVIFLPSNNGLPPEMADVVAQSRAVDIARAREQSDDGSSRCSWPHRRSGFVRLLRYRGCSRNGP
jgi:predicted amidohydrolase